MEISASNRKKKKRLITFSGVDGSGKSTIIDHIKRKFPEFKCLSIIRFRWINRIFPKKTKVGNERNIKRAAPLNQMLLIMDIIFFYFFYRLTEKTILCDRYFYDLIISHRYRSGGDSSEFAFFKHIIPKPDIAFLILASPEKVQTREVGDFHSLSYFIEKTFLYKNMGGWVTFLPIENHNIEISVAQVEKQIGRVINS